jgi:hypothetical protein
LAVAAAAEEQAEAVVQVVLGLQQALLLLAELL